MLRAALPPTDRSKPEADEGRQTHTLGVDLIDLGLRSLFPVTEDDIKSDLNLDQKSAAWLYANNFVKSAQTLGIFGGPNLGIEKKVTAPKIHPLLYGTPDAWIYSSKTNDLIIWDLKYGFGIVEAFENWQMICYAAGLIEQYSLPAETKCYLRIVQPRGFHKSGPIRQWKVPVGTLQTGYLSKLQSAANEALSGKSTLQPGSHCRYCDGRHICSILKRETLATADSMALETPDILEPEAIGRELTVLENAKYLLDQRVDALQQHALSLITKGENIPGYTVEKTRGTLIWLEEPEKMIEMAKGVGVDLSKPAICTPTQAIGKGLHTGIVNAFSKRVNKKTKLKPVDTAEARQVFGGEE
jgi:hypothetical protein